MRKLLHFAIVVAIAAQVVTMTSCKKDPPPSTNGYVILKAHMLSNSLDLPSLLTSWVVDPKSTNQVGGIVDSVTGAVPGYTVYDIRSATDYTTSHIKNAVNVVLKDIITKVTTDNIAKDAKILVVCYTGQTAGQAVMALRLSGWKNAQVLKWGMAGWNPAFKGSWVNNSGFETPANGDLAVGHANWVTSAAPANGSYSEPVWQATTTDPATILKTRVQAVLDAGFSTENGQTVLNTPANYTIVNYWANTDYTTLGHFNGAFNVPTISLAGDLVKNFDPSKLNLVYCWTGQTSSVATFWLNVLGYQTKSIGFGANRMIYSALKTAKKTIYPGSKNWPVYQ